MEAENKKASFLAIILIVGLGIASIFIWLFLELAEEIFENELRRFDNSIIASFNAIKTPMLDAIYTFITELGSVWFLASLSVIMVLLLWLKAKNRWGTLFFIIAIGGNGTLTWLLKKLYHRGRPSINQAIDAIGFSFPSGHSMGSIVFYGFLIYLIIRSGYSKVIKVVSSIVLILLILSIGTSRIYLSAHFPSDVIGGFLAGTIWLILCLLALEWVQWQGNSQINPIYALQELLTSSYRSMKQKRER